MDTKNKFRTVLIFFEAHAACKKITISTLLVFKTYVTRTVKKLLLVSKKKNYFILEVINFKEVIIIQIQIKLSNFIFQDQRIF